MAITTLAGVAGGQMPPDHRLKVPSGTLVAGRHHSLWGQAPFAGSYDTTLAGVALSSSTNPVTGQLYRRDPVSGNAYLSKLYASLGANSISGTVIVADRLWHNGGFTITSTAAQTVNSATFPARDATGTTDGDGVLLGLEVSATVGAATPTITISYTNQAGTSGKTATNTIAVASASVASSFYPISLQAGDTGVRSVQSLTLSASLVSGTINLVAYRPYAILDCRYNGVFSSTDALTSVMPRVFNGTVPFVIINTNSNPSGLPLQFNYSEAQG